MASRRRLIMRIAAAKPSRFSSCDCPRACSVSYIALHDALMRCRHSTFLAQVERGPSHYNITIFLGDTPMARICQGSCAHRLLARLSSAHP
jgi:hypothetical protein